MLDALGEASAEPKSGLVRVRETQMSSSHFDRC